MPRGRARIPYGAVSNAHDYQRVKLDIAGLEGIQFVVGTELSDPQAGPRHVPRRRQADRQHACFHPLHLYIGDNRLLDAEGRRRQECWASG